MRKQLLITCFFMLANLLLVVTTSQAHIGSPGVFYEGKAGKYAVLVNIIPPEVIPGTAQVNVFVTAEDILSVRAKPVYWYTGDKGSPSSDELATVNGMPGQYQGIVWLMANGAASINVQIIGESETGVINVPIMAVSTAQNEMPQGLGITLAILGLLLVVLMVTIIGSSVSDGLIPAGESIPGNLKKKKLSGIIGGSILLILILYGGKTWWDNEATDYRRFMYKPPKINSSIAINDSVNSIRFEIDTAALAKNRLEFGYLVPDHGKLVHMFVIRDKTYDVFAHLHPVRVDEHTFETIMPELPEGKYLLFADVVRLNGFTETLSDTLEITGSGKSQTNSFLDPDDTFVVLATEREDKPQTLDNSIVVCGKPGVSTKLPDGSSAFFENQSGNVFVAGKMYPLVFAFNDPAGNPAQLEPYMGMMGHAVVLRKEGGVYIHLHPVGNYSMASQQILESRFNTDETKPFIAPKDVFMDSIDQVISRIASMEPQERNNYLMQGMEHDAVGIHESHGSTITFPYAFPKEGEYRIFIQFKQNGQILNSSFDVQVTGSSLSI